MAYTALVTVLLLLLGTVSSNKNEDYIILALDWAMNFGEWGPPALCPHGTFTYAFQLKVETEDAYDDTAMNGIELFCRSLGDVGQGGVPPRKHAREFSITSTVDGWGNWRGKRECPQGLLTGLRMKSEEYQGIFDDTAANDLEMQCDWSTTTMNGGGDHWGRWSSWISCPEGRAICGIETRVESQTATDDTALNDVRMLCCHVGNFNTTTKDY